MCELMVLINSDNLKHLAIGTYLYCVLQLASTSPICFILKPKLNWHSVSLFSAFSLITVTLEIWIMEQSKVNRELADLGVYLTSTNMTKGYATQSKSMYNSPLCGAEENNLLPLHTISSDDNVEALAGATATASPLSLPTNNSASMNLSQNSARMKCYFHCEHNHFLGYIEDPIMDDAVIYMSDIPFHYNRREGRYIEFIGNPTGTIFIATKRDHDFLLSQSNALNVSSNLNNFRQLNVTESCNNLTKITPANTIDMSHHMHHTQKRDADAEYLGRFKMALNTCMGGINFTDPANIRIAHEELMTQVRTEVIHISNKYKMQVEHIQFEWDRFLHIFDQDFPGIMKEMLSCNSQQQPPPPNLNDNRSTPNENREQYHGGIDNRTITLTTLSPSARHLNMENKFQHTSHSTPGTTDIYSGNGHAMSLHPGSMPSIAVVSNCIINNISEKQLKQDR